MKIAILRKKYSFHGGAEGFSHNLIARLADAGHEVHLYAIQWEADSYRNVYFHKVPSITFISFLRDLTFALSSWLVLRKETFDIIQSNDKTLYQDIYRAGDGCHVEWLKQRWKRTGLWGKLSMLCNPYHWLILGIEKSIFKQHRYRKIVAISEMVKRNIIENYSISPADIEVIYNGVDTEKYHPENRNKNRKEIREQYGLAEEDFVVLFVGSGFERKGVEYLIQAVETLDIPVSVLIAGKGSPARLKLLAKRQNVIFCGPRKDVHKYYAAADVFVFPTIYEPFGNVHLEALASGLPVITTKCSGASEIIEEGVQGFVINEPEDFNAIAGHIKTLSDREKRLSMGRDARSLAETFKYENYIGKILDLYGKISAEKKSAGSVGGSA